MNIEEWVHFDPNWRGSHTFQWSRIEGVQFSHISGSPEMCRSPCFMTFYDPSEQDSAAECSCAVHPGYGHPGTPAGRVSHLQLRGDGLLFPMVEGAEPSHEGCGGLSTANAVDSFSWQRRLNFQPLTKVEFQTVTIMTV